jgi:hypothetical protein
MLEIIGYILCTILIFIAINGVTTNENARRGASVIAMLAAIVFAIFVFIQADSIRHPTRYMNADEMIQYYEDKASY